MAERYEQDLSALPWLLRQRITPPAEATGHMARPELVARCLPMRQRLTLLLAPGGFGKTTLLAECCRALQSEGVPVAWLTLDERDEASTLDAYLVLAFERAGLQVVEDTRLDSLDTIVPIQRIGMLLRALTATETPCVLALDELEQLTNPEAVTLLDYFLRYAPPNLHMAFACRQLPAGFGLASAVLDGPATIVTVDDLRFSRREIAKFFDLELSRRELGRVVDESAGWPIALRIYRNEREFGPPDRKYRDLVGNWVESRLWRNLSPGDREFVLYLGLFDWIDAELVSEVLGTSDAEHRLETTPALSGLLDRIPRASSAAWRLHPLVREHCAQRLYSDDPTHFRDLQGRIARALARRGDTLAAMGHAAKAGDPHLVGKILIDAGHYRLMLMEGVQGVQQADRYLTPEVLAIHPQLALVRCLTLAMTQRVGEARRIYASFVTEFPDTDMTTRVGRVIVQGLIFLHGYEAINTAEASALAQELNTLAESSEIDSLSRGTIGYGLCIQHSMKAEFDLALERAELARRYLGSGAYPGVYVDLQLGQIAMAQGRVKRAVAHYAKAQRFASRNFVQDPMAAATFSGLNAELRLERHRLGADYGNAATPTALRIGLTSFSVCAAACAVIAETRRERDGTEAATAFVHEVRQDAYSNELPALARYTSAVAVSLLADAGSLAEAERDWRLGRLPKDNAGCLDLDGQSWREMEAITCARLGLLGARGDFAEGVELAAAALALTETRGLRRTHMRILALCMRLEYRHENKGSATGRLEEFLRLLAETDYVRPLVRERETVLALIGGLMDETRDEVLHNTAAEVRAILEPPPKDAPTFSSRELEICQLLASHTDKEIAREIELSPDGVRYHVRSIFAKLDVGDRHEAVRRAQHFGLI